MKLLISGEGISDMGACNNAQGQCSDSHFTQGPMTVWLTRLCESLFGYDLNTIPEAIIYISEKKLAQDTKSKSGGKMQAIRGKKHFSETGFYFNNAKQLGLTAKEITETAEEPVIAIIFRDFDGVNSTSDKEWKDKWDSMINGFNAAEFAYGVPMLPKPKSEAWLLCAAREGNHSCADLEDISGNDNSPNSAKLQLKEKLGENCCSGEKLAEFCETNPNDWKKLRTMPSFEAFYQRLKRVVILIRPNGGRYFIW